MQLVFVIVTIIPYILQLLLLHDLPVAGYRLVTVWLSTPNMSCPNVSSLDAPSELTSTESQPRVFIDFHHCKNELVNVGLFLP